MSLKVSGERLLAEALADAMDRDRADGPPREQLEQQHRFSKKFVRRMKRLETVVKDGQETQTAAETSERPQSGGGRIVDFRRLGAMAKRYSGLAAALVCVIGLAAVVGVMSRSLRMGKSFTDAGIMEESAADTAAPEGAWDDAVEEPSAEAEDDAAAGVAESEATDDSASDGIADNGAPDDAKGEHSPGEQPTEQETMAPDWQEQLLLESEKANELVTWHLCMIYDDGSIGLTSDVVNPSKSTVVAPGETLYVSGVFEVYYEQNPDEWECVYRTKRSRDNYSAATSWGEWYALGELYMTQAGTYRLVRQVNSYRQVLQLTLEEQ